MAGQYWFPSMSIPEIVEAFSGWGISVSDEQVTSITQDALQDSLQAALATLESPDMYSQALAHNFLLFHLQRFARAAKIMDFSARDISFPDPERTRSIFSAFINLVKFSEQCEPFVSNLRNKSAAVLEERDKVIRQLEESQERIAARKIKLAEDEPKCETLRKENDAITAYLLSCKERQMVLLEEVKNLKQQKAVVIQRKENVHADTEQVADAIGRTRSRIVQSPERIKRNIITMGSAAAEEKRTVTQHENKIRDLQIKSAALLNIEKDVRSCIEQLQTIEKEMTELDASKKELADLKDELSVKRGECNELMLKRERVHKQFSNAQEKLERAQKHAEDKRMTSQQTIERLQKEYEEMAVERRDNDRQVEELRAEASEIERKMAEHMKSSQTELGELLAEYWKLRHETEIYMETLANKLGMHIIST